MKNFLKIFAEKLLKNLIKSIEYNLRIFIRKLITSQAYTTQGFKGLPGTYTLAMEALVKGKAQYG